VSVNPIGLAQGNEFWKAQSNITGSTFTNGSFSTTVTSNPAIAPATSGSTPLSNPSLDSVFGPGITSAVFTQSFDVAGGPNAALVNSVGLSLTQRRPGNEVPGPLPILGAGVAFGLSRKGKPSFHSPLPCGRGFFCPFTAASAAGETASLARGKVAGTPWMIRTSSQMARRLQKQ
jgi:hypothetical protein